MRAFLKLELKWFQKKGDTGTGRILIQNFNLTYRNQPSMATICTSSLYLLQKLSCVTTQQTPLHYSNLEINKERKGGKKWKKKKTWRIGEEKVSEYNTVNVYHAFTNCWLLWSKITGTMTEGLLIHRMMNTTGQGDTLKAGSFEISIRQST